MDGDMLMIAHIDIDSRGRALHAPGPWLPSGGLPFQPLDSLDFPSSLLNKVFSFYLASYVLPGASLAKPAQLFKYDRWVVFRYKGKPVGAMLFRATSFGIKLGIYCTDGTALAKQAMIKFIDAALVVPGCYGEVSPPLEVRISPDVPRVPFGQVAEVLGKAISSCADEVDDGFHYCRTIGTLGIKRKLMVGMPLL